MITKTCPQCKEKFDIDKYISTTVYCSKRCQRKYNADKRRQAPQWMTDIDDMLKAARA